MARLEDILCLWLRLKIKDPRRHVRKWLSIIRQISSKKAIYRNSGKNVAKQGFTELTFSQSQTKNIEIVNTGRFHEELSFPELFETFDSVIFRIFTLSLTW